MRWYSRVLALTFLVLQLTSPRLLSAQSEPQAVQAGLRVLYVINESEQTVSIYQSASFQHLTDSVTWVFPLPAEPASVEIVDSNFFDEFEQDAAPNLQAPPDTGCELAPIISYRNPTGSFPVQIYADVQDRYIVGNPSQVIAFAAQSNAPLSPAQAQVLETAGTETFVALNVTPAEDEPESMSSAVLIPLDATPAVRATYAYSDEAELAQLLTLYTSFRSELAISTLSYDERPGVFGVVAYVLAETPYGLAAVPELTVDLKQIDSNFSQVSQILLSTSSPFVDAAELYAQYYTLVQQAAEDSGFQGMARETVFPGERITNELSSNTVLPDEISRRLEDGILSRFFTLLPQGAGAVGSEEVFQFAPDAQAETGRLRLAASVDQTYFYGCTTRLIQDTSLEARLPNGRTYIPSARLPAAHPEGWELIEVASPRPEELPIYVLAPAGTSPDQLFRLEQGAQDGGPVFAFQPFNLPYSLTENESGGRSVVPPNFDALPFGAEELADGISRLAHTVYFPGNIDPFFMDDLSNIENVRAQGVRLALIAPQADFAENEALYSDMMAYVLSRQFMISGQLRHTVFSGLLPDLISIGYPDDWIETRLEGNLVIAPIAALGLTPEQASRDVLGLVPDLSTRLQNSPAVVIRDLGNDEDFREVLRQEYGIAEPNGSLMDEGFVSGISFATTERSGYLRFNFAPFQVSIIEISAPAEQASEYDDLLRAIAESVVLNSGQQWILPPRRDNCCVG